MNLKQTQFLKGSRYFELIDETLFIRVKSFLKEQNYTVDLSLLDTEPVVEGKELYFYSPHKGRPVFSMLVNKPDAKSYNQFVNALQSAISGDNTSEQLVDVADSTREEALNRNFHEAPPAFAEHNEIAEEISFKPANPDRLLEDIDSLKICMDESTIRSFLDALQALMEKPGDRDIFEKMLSEFNELGFNQGAVLTYAPYTKVLVSDSINMLEKLGSGSYLGVKGN